MKTVLAGACALLCLCVCARAQERPQAYTGAQIITVSGPTITDGVLVVQRGKIVAVGSRAATKIPADAETFDVSGKVIMPGLVDSHSHIGNGSGGDASAPIQPDVRILDSIDVRSSGIKRARAGGITTVNVMPGSGLLLSGQTLYLKLRNGKTIDDLLIRDAQGTIAGGIKMANGTNPLRPDSTGPFPGTRSKAAALVREQFLRAQDYREKIRRAGNDKSKLPARDLALEALVEALDGKRTVHFHTHRHDDILTALRLSKEFGFRIVLHHVSEGWKVADEIAAAKAPASVILIDSPGGKLEALDASLTTGAALERAGVLVGFHTDDYITDSRLFLRMPALAVRTGMSRDRALFAMTLAGAQMLDLQARTGSLQAGKDADFIVLSGDPLSVYTHVLQTYVEGIKVFDRANPQDRLYAVGGYGAGSDRFHDTDCFDRREGEDK
ncbi:MAG TPA: amidohydrolase family protein [Pyrinomonadaceae bacterium]|nr:amidohydrolase family protein [Pyrinomonadaceae bacterium]